MQAKYFIYWFSHPKPSNIPLSNRPPENNNHKIFASFPNPNYPSNSSVTFHPHIPWARSMKHPKYLILLKLTFIKVKYYVNRSEANQTFIISFLPWCWCYLWSKAISPLGWLFLHGDPKSNILALMPSGR